MPNWYAMVPLFWRALSGVKPLLFCVFCRGGKWTVKRADLYRFFLVATKYCPTPMPFVFCGE